MANERSGGKVINFIEQNYLAVFLLVGIFAFFLPLPNYIIDLLMILNLAFSFIVLLVVINTPRASNFQTFPRIILFQTLFGLAINVASTRLILGVKQVTNATALLNTQSSMVRAFADIVAGSDPIIGFIIFVILVIVQVLVITKGAGRVSEVAARFSLDAMQQKYFDIDNRLNTGVIDDQEALRLKNEVSKEIDFYSNMDGASKFVSGNVKAGIFITVVNLVGGFAIGSFRHNLNLTQSLEVFSKLTIGDGLLSQFPALIISFATGILVTGTKSDEDLGEQLKSDFSRSGYIYAIVGAVLAVLGIALRKGTQFLLVPIGILFIVIGVRFIQKQQRKVAVQKAEEEKQAATNQTAASNPEENEISMLDPLSLELGYALIPLVSKEKGAELLERITRIRNEAKLDMGFVIPKIRIRDNMTLDPNDYSFKINGIEAGHANIRPGYYMCMDTGTVTTPLQGEKTKDPAFGMDAIWLPQDQKTEAENAGYVVVDPPTIIATHLTEIIKANASKMLGRLEVSQIIETVKKKNSILVTEVLETAGISYGVIEKVLKNLLDENVSIRDIVAILETLANYGGATKNPWDLTMKVRESLGLQICKQYVDVDNKLRVMRLSQEFSQMIMDHGYIPDGLGKPQCALDPVDREKWLKCVSASFARVTQKGYQPIILCVQAVRQLVKASLEREMPGIVVLADMEIFAAGNSIQVEVIDDIDEKSGDL